MLFLIDAILEKQSVQCDVVSKVKCVFHPITQTLIKHLLYMRDHETHQMSKIVLSLKKHIAKITLTNSY